MGLVNSVQFLLVGSVVLASSDPRLDVDLPLRICNGVTLSRENSTALLNSFHRLIPPSLSSSSRLVHLRPIRILSPGESCESSIKDANHDPFLRKMTFLIGDSNKTSTSSKDVIPLSLNNLDGKVYLSLGQNGTSAVGFDQICILPQFLDESDSPSFRLAKCRQSQANCSLSQPCVRKCCDLDEVWDIHDGLCVPRNQSRGDWSPDFHELTDDGDCVLKLESEKDSVILYDVGLPSKCSDKSEWNAIPSKNIPGEVGLGRFRLLVNGSVVMNHKNGSWVLLPRGSFCVDELRSHHGNVKALLVCKDSFQVRGPKKPIPSEYALILFSSAIILVLIAVVYVLIWDRHSVYEWTVFCEVLAMIGMIVLLAVSHTTARDPSEGYFGSGKCIALGMMSHYFFLATFFWLFVINFEIWWNFRSLMIRHKKGRFLLRLLNYQIVGWGCPVLIVLIGWALDRSYGLQNDRKDCTSLILPNYGQTNCYISKRAQGPYLYYPVGILLGCNLLFYLLTVFKMIEYSKNSASLSQNKSSGQFQPLHVFARLFIVMGVSWIAEIVSWAYNPNVQSGIPLYWIIFDFVTLIQAIAIFIIFVCRKEIVAKYLDKYPKLEGFLVGPLASLRQTPPNIINPRMATPSPQPRKSDDEASLHNLGQSETTSPPSPRPNPSNGSNNFSNVNNNAINHDGEEQVNNL